MRRSLVLLGAVGLLGAALAAAPVADDLLHGRCPVRHADAAAQERLRGYRIAPQLSEVGARAWPALGFTLGITRRAEVERVSSATSATCEPSERSLRCSSWPSTSGVRHVQFFFDERSYLVGVDLFRNESEDRLRQRLAQVERDVQASSGPAQVVRAASGGLTSVTLAYSDYLAKLMLLKVGTQPATLREQYDVVRR